MALKINPLTGNFDVVEPSQWEEVTGAYPVLTQKTPGALFIDTRNESTPYTIAGGITPDANFVANGGYGAINIVGLSTHGSTGGFLDLGSLLFFNRSRGTVDTPLPIQNGDFIGGQVFGGYDGSDYQLTLSGMLAVATDDWNSTSGAMDLRWIVGGAEIFSSNSQTDQTTASYTWQFNNQLLIADGAAGSPYFAFANDQDTGIYSVDLNNKLGIATNGDAAAFFGTGATTSPFLELAPATKTFDANSVLIGVNDQYNLDYVNAASPPGFDYSSTLVYSQNGWSFGSGIGFWMRPVITNNSASTRTIGPWIGYGSQTTYQANGGSLSGQAIDYFAQATFNRINSGTVSFSNHYNFWAQGGTVATGATVTNRYGFFFQETGTINGTLTSEAAFVSATLGGTNKTHVLLGTSTIPSGSYGIYQSSTEANLLNGETTIGADFIVNKNTTGNTQITLNNPNTGGSTSTTFQMNQGGTARAVMQYLRTGLIFKVGGANNVNTSIQAGNVVGLTMDASTRDITFTDGVDFILGSTNGTKIGTATTEKLGFWNSTPVVQNTGWSVTNVSSDKTFDANATTVNELADVLGTLIDTLKTYGILGA
jgi:hypothetical protein